MGSWIDQMFDAEASKTDGVVRRQVDSVTKFGSEEELVEEVKQRGFHLIQAGDQYVILCTTGDFRVIV